MKKVSEAHIFPVPVAILSIWCAKPTAIFAAVGFVIHGFLYNSSIQWEDRYEKLSVNATSNPSVWS